MTQDTINTLVTTGAIAAIALSPWGDPQLKGIAITGLAGMAPGALGGLRPSPSRARKRIDTAMQHYPAVEASTPEFSGDM